MFQLIVAVIAIALVIALTLASIFYGGEAFTRSSLKANVAAMVNQAQQISGAHTLYKTDFSKPADTLADLAPAYLAEIPTAPKIVLQEDGESVAWEYRTLGAKETQGVYIQLGAEADETCVAVAQNGVGECQATDGTEGTDYFVFPL